MNTQSFTRREFLRMSAAAAVGVVLTACKKETAEPTPESTLPAQVKGGRALPDDAAPPDQQVLRIPTTDNRYVCSGIGG